MGETERVKTADVVFEVIETLMRMDGARVSELSDEMNIAKSTAHRHLATLEDLEYLTKDGDIYNVGVNFLRVGEYARRRDPAFPMAEKTVTQLATETEERAQFLVESHGRAVYIYRSIGEHGIDTDAGIGKQAPLHATAAGKSILSSYPKSKIEGIIDQHGLESITTSTITDRMELFEQLEEIRNRGYALNMQESIEGMRAIGAPVERPNGQVVGGISISGPTHRMKGERLKSKIPKLLLGAINELELNIAHS